jgi:RecB family exonuclease
MQIEQEIVKLTPSLVAALRQCALHATWQRAHPEARPVFAETPATARGKSLHGALAEFHRQGGAETQTLADLRRLLGELWVREGYPDAEEEQLARLRCEAELDTYYEVFGRDGGTLATERSYSFYRNLGEVRTEWFGRIDWLRTLPEGRGIEVVDWKTHGRTVPPESLAADPVTVMYGRLARALAQRQLGWTGGPVRFSLLFLDRAEKVSVDLTREMVQAAEAELARLAHGLRHGGLPPGEGPWCFWQGGCPVRLAGECPLFPAPTEEGEW